MLIDDDYAYRGGVLFCEDVNLNELADEHGTPAYVYSRASIERHFLAYEAALAAMPHRVCYAVKANSNIAILQLLGRLGAGFDIVSGGELHRVLKAGIPANRVVFSGVGKTAEEIGFALEQGIYAFNCESEAELELLSATASRLGRTASIAFRVNPDVDAATHPYISTGLKEHKFGIGLEDVERLYAKAITLPGIKAHGISCHIGSQLLDYAPILESLGKLLKLIERLRVLGVEIHHLDVGGGIGARYRPEDKTPCVQTFGEALVSRLQGSGLEVLLEPGRSIVAESGVLLTRVLLVKRNGSKTFVIVDGAMNDLIRPTLYQAHHEIVHVNSPGGGASQLVDIVGPVCETGDFLARNRPLAQTKEGDLLAVETAGAYGFVLASNYNSRPRPVELLVSDSQATVIRRRETIADLINGESLLPGLI